MRGRAIDSGHHLAEDAPGELTDAIVESVLTYQDGIAEDDIAVLAVRRTTS